MAVMERLRGRRQGDAGPTREGAPRTTRDDHAVARGRQHQEFGGINWGSAFFGWLVAIGLAALLTALVAAAGAAVAISELDDVGDAAGSAETIGLGGGIALLVVALIAYFAGGYVAGRMSRFDGARQGLGVWAWGIVAAIILAVIGAIAGSEYNLLGALDLPRIPVDEGTLTTGGVVFLVAALLGTLLAAMGGGRAGHAYHDRVDAVGRAALDDRREAAAAERSGTRRFREDGEEPDRERAGTRRDRGT